MKKFAKQLLSISLMILAMTLTGCGQANLGVETSVAMGNYIGKEIDFPDIDPSHVANEYLVQGENGDVYCYAIEDSCKIYILSEDVEWKLQKEIKLPNEIRKIYKILNAQGKMQIAYADKQANMYVAIQQEDNTFKTVKLNKDHEPIKERVNNNFTMDIDNNGDIYINMNMGDGRIQKYSGQTGDQLKEFIDNVQDFVVIENMIYGVNTKDRAIKVYDGVNGELVKSMSCGDGGTIKLSKGIDNGDLYMCNGNGIFHLTKDGVLWEQIITADKLERMDSQVKDYALYINKDSLLVYYDRNGMDMLLRYYYDKDMVTNPSKTIEVSMLFEDNLLRKATEIYQEQHKDLMVHARSSWRNHRRLSNNELERGILQDKGMDLIEQEGLAPYITEGNLADITDVVEELVNDGVINEKIASNFEEDNKYYNIPLRYMVGTIWGNKEILNQVETLEDLVQYKKQHPEQILFGKTKLELFYQLRNSCSSSWFDKNGKFDENKYRAFLEDITALEEVKYDNIHSNKYCGSIIMEETKKKEILDVAEGKTQLVMIAPNSLEDVAEIMDTLSSREDITVKNLIGQDGCAMYGVSGILGINAMSESQEEAKEIIRIALSEDVQKLQGEAGMPMNKEALKAQETSNASLKAYPELYDEFKKCTENINFCLNNVDAAGYIYITEQTHEYCMGHQSIDDTISNIRKAINEYYDEFDMYHEYYKLARFN